MDTTPAPQAPGSLSSIPTQLEILEKLNAEAQEKLRAQTDAMQMKTELAEMKRKEAERAKRKMMKERDRVKKEFEEYSRVLTENQKVKPLSAEDAAALMKIFEEANQQLESEQPNMDHLLALASRAHVEVRASKRACEAHEELMAKNAENERLRKENELLQYERQCAGYVRAYNELSAGVSTNVRVNASHASASLTPPTAAAGAAAAAASNVPGTPATRGIPMPSFTTALANERASMDMTGATASAAAPAGIDTHTPIDTSATERRGEYCIDTRASTRELIQKQSGVDPSQYRNPYIVAKMKLGRAPTTDEVDQEMLQMEYFRKEMVQTRASLSGESVGFQIAYNQRTGLFEAPSEYDVQDTISVPVDPNYSQFATYPATDVRRRTRASMRQIDPNRFYSVLQMINDKSLSDDFIDATIQNTRKATRARNKLPEYAFLHNNVDRGGLSDTCFEH